MAKALRRILRFRQLAEEQARLEVERAAQLSRQASAACERQVALERQQRSTLAESWILRENEGPEGRRNAAGNPSILLSSEAVEEKGWLMEEAALEFSGWKLLRLQQLREAELRRMEPMIENYTERRRELRQVEQLIQQRAAIEAMKQDRRAQAQTDEWFLQRGLMKQRRERQRMQQEKPEASVERTFLGG